MTPGLREQATQLDESDIVAIMNVARSKPDIIPLWVGEGDLPTPEFISEAASRSLADGETFYTWQRGIPELRDALATYHSRHFDIAHDPDRFFVVGSGMQAIQIALQALVDAGDEVIMLTPCWPNIHSATQVVGATPVHVELDFSQNGWSLNMQRLVGAVSNKTRAMFINTPSNPTGWTATESDLRAILAFAKERGIWVIADEVYSRFVYDCSRFPKGRAPSFYDVAEPDDPVIYVNTFSKNWAMTGWRAGWLSAPPTFGQVFENLIQYSTSGVATFTQRGAVAALEQGEPFVQFQRDRAAQNRTTLCDALNATQRVQFAAPDGGFYLFFRIEGMNDSKEVALRLAQEANVGLAPGTGFYTGAKPFLRLCFMRDPAQVAEGTRRLVEWIDAL